MPQTSKKKRSFSQNIPADKELEERVLGDIIVDPALISQCSLRSYDFWDEDLSALYDLMLGISITENPRESLQSEIEKQELNINISDIEQKANADSFNQDAMQLIHLSLLRQFANTGESLASEALSPEANLANMMSNTHAILEEAQSRYQNNSKNLMITSITIIPTNPRQYRLTMNYGPDVIIKSTKQLMKPQEVETAIVSQRDKVPTIPKNWRRIVSNMFDHAYTDKAPLNADVNQEALEYIRQLFELRGEADAASDMNEGSYVKEVIYGRTYYLFQRTPVIRYLRSHFDKNLTSAGFWGLVSGWGGISEKKGKSLSKKIGGATRTQLWALPAYVIEYGYDSVQESYDYGEDDGQSNEEIDASFLD